MEMTHADGFKLHELADWYGDWIGRQVWETTRVLPWLESGPARYHRPSSLCPT